MRLTRRHSASTNLDQADCDTLRLDVMALRPDGSGMIARFNLKPLLPMNPIRFSAAALLTACALGTTTLLGGCSSNALSTASAVVSLVDPAVLDQLKPGLSTVADAIKLLGNPAVQTAQADGNQLMQWKLAAPAAAAAAQTNLKAQTASVLFDKAGKMLSPVQLGK